MIIKKNPKPCETDWEKGPFVRIYLIKEGFIESSFILTEWSDFYTINNLSTAVLDLVCQ